MDINSAADTLSLLGEGVISTPLYERDIAISPQGDEIVYTLGDYKQTCRGLVILTREGEQWSEPALMNISGEYMDIEPFYSHDGQRLYFASNRPIFNDSTRKDYNIWYSDRLNDGWSAPVALDSLINTRADEFYPSLSRNGNLYFTATRPNGIGREDIFMSELINGHYQTPKPLPAEVNSDLYEFNAFISPDEDYLLFGSFGRSDGLGGGDIYISEKDSLGHWTQARNLGSPINSDKLDFCPFVDASSRNFYFTSERSGNQKSPIKSIAELKTSANSPLNGFGNIYKISFEALNVKTTIISKQ
ncbi:PD40 domain-containing protein [Carboxylicivirga mesophila]|uniref:PD40 domain-containing protein n=1 Tax=Carboxylicivirga mesophila TaxID=1166478 RepID=A0ABS5KF32_9BACT|nr:PD40 domain-containing protein [Carboxylicivirga mesophila]MBS2213581.1 PD40 domain-containing protein [Carboxylicivirga mesophila]